MDPRITKAEAALMMPFHQPAAAQSHGAQLAHSLDARPRAGLFVRVAAWIERRRAQDELSALTDRELADIGLHRGDIPFVFAAAKAAPERARGGVPASYGASAYA